MMSEHALPTVDDCEGCGVCCLHMGYPAFIRETSEHPAEEFWLTLPADLRAELLAYIAGYQEPAEGELDGPCVWFDPTTRRCRHHQHRPQVCRSFLVGGIDCRQWRKAYSDRIALSSIRDTKHAQTLCRIDGE